MAEYGVSCNLEDAEKLLKYSGRVKKCRECDGTGCDGWYELATFLDESQEIQLRDERRGIPSLTGLKKPVIVQWRWSECRYLGEKMRRRTAEKLLRETGLPLGALRQEIPSDIGIYTSR